MRTVVSMAMATSLVRSLFTGSEEADTILLEDTVDHSARSLLKCCAHHLAKRFSAVHLFLFDIDSNQWLSGLSPEVADKITVHDGFSDPLGWDADKNPPSSLVCLKNCSAQSFIDSLGEKPPRKDRAVLIDSLSSLLLHQSPAAVCRMIHTLGVSSGHCSVTVCLVHTDLHQDHVTTQLRHVTSTSILVQRIDPGAASSLSSGSGLCSVTHKRKSGKVLRKTEQYNVSQSFSILSTTDHHGSLPLTSDSHEMTSEPDPTANLTFDLHLSSKEKEERSKVILPYTAVRDGGVGVASGLTGHAFSGGGQIYYQPDDVDDFDESDPDDDLDV